MPKQELSALFLGLLAAAVLLIVFNQYQLVKLGKATTGSAIALSSPASNTSTDIASLIPQGTPSYGQALGVSFDDPTSSLDRLAQLDSIELSGPELQRYIKIGTMPGSGCEFCCGANVLTDSRGRPLCGCKHAYALRGLTKWLVANSALSDEEIFGELQRWKTLFFPRQMVARALQTGGKLDSETLASLPGMVGGC